MNGVSAGRLPCHRQPAGNLSRCTATIHRSDARGSPAEPVGPTAPVIGPASQVGSDPVDAIEQTVTAGNSTLTYEATAQQYVYVWKTDKAWPGTYRDGSCRG